MQESRKDKCSAFNPPQNCPKCGSKSLYFEVSVVAMQKISTGGYTARVKWRYRQYLGSRLLR